VTTIWDSDPLAALNLGELADLVAVFPGVLTGIDPLSLQVLGRGAEDLGEVGSDPLLAVLPFTNVLRTGIAAGLRRVDDKVFHAPNWSMDAGRQRHRIVLLLCAKMPQVSERSAQARAVVSRALRNDLLRRVVLAYGLFFGAEWAVWIAFLVYGYTHGGASGAMTIALVQVLPSAVLAPVLGTLSDRCRPGRVLCAGYLAEAASMIAAAALIEIAAPRLTVFAIAAVVNLGITVTRPAQAALVPAIVRTPDELTSSNVLTGWCQSGGELIAPMIGGALLALHGPALAIAGTALMAFVAAVLVARIPGPERTQASETSEGEFRSGFSIVARDPALRVLLGVQGFYQVS
jgi:Na+/melibiose symporter-like transporter